jgi:hypothetical protein
MESLIEIGGYVITKKRKTIGSHQSNNIKNKFLKLKVRMIIPTLNSKKDENQLMLMFYDYPIPMYLGSVVNYYDFEKYLDIKPSEILSCNDPEFERLVNFRD